MAELSAEDPDKAISSVMRTLTASAIATNLSRCTVLDRVLTALEQGRATEPERVEAEQAAHQMVGSAGTFGFPRVSELAAELETHLARAAALTGGDPGAEAGPADLDRARVCLTQIQQDLARGSAGGHQPER